MAKKLAGAPAKPAVPPFRLQFGPVVSKVVKRILAGNKGTGDVGRYPSHQVKSVPPIPSRR
jgi:hypothetical protein